jgi:hypothetical protein
MKKQDERKQEKERKMEQKKKIASVSACFSVNIAVRMMISCLFHLHAQTCVDIHRA